MPASTSSATAISRNRFTGTRAPMTPTVPASASGTGKGRASAPQTVCTRAGTASDRPTVTRICSFTRPYSRRIRTSSTTAASSSPVRVPTTAASTSPGIPPTVSAVRQAV
ncbi:hypothetical protein RKD39_001182 [Streptomyces albogriseolus]